MNQGRIWCVVNPTVGLPLFLGSVAVTSLIVHYSVLSNTTWFSSYWNGSAKRAAAAPEDTTRAVAATAAANGFVITVSQLPATAAKTDTSFVVSVAPPGDQLALAGASQK